MRHYRIVLLSIISVLIMSSLAVYAKPDAVIYSDSISEDENGDPLSFPSSVYVDRYTQEIYIIDGRGRIIIYSPDLVPIYTLNKKHGIVLPETVAVDRDGRIYVGLGRSTDKGPRIAVYSPCLVHERDIYLEKIKGEREFVPHRIAINSRGELIVVANRYQGAAVLKKSGTLVDMISPVEGGKRVRLTSVTVDRRDNIYLLSEDRGRVYVYNSMRKPLFAFGEKGGISGKLSRPRGIVVDYSGKRTYIVDYMRHTVSVYNDKGEYLFEFGGLGFDPGWFWFPSDIGVDRRGRIFVADFFNHRVQVFATRIIKE